jgi:hypothetical protein
MKWRLALPVFLMPPWSGIEIRDVEAEETIQLVSGSSKSLVRKLNITSS